MDSVEQIKAWIEEAVPGAQLELVPNESPANPPSLAVGRAQAVAVACFLRDDPRLRLDHATSVTGVDWLERVWKEKVKVRKTIEGVEKEIEETVEKRRPACLEVGYHLYSMALKHGPLILRQRAANRTDDTRVASLTPVYRSAEFQEREAYDLYGIVFEGHPDLRRILMWEGFQDFPMRKDYERPDDYEWEPTPHEAVLARVRRRSPPEASE